MLKQIIIILSSAPRNSSFIIRNKNIPDGASYINRVWSYDIIYKVRSKILAFVRAAIFRFVQ